MGANVNDNTGSSSAAEHHYCSAVHAKLKGGMDRGIVGEDEVVEGKRLLGCECFEASNMLFHHSSSSRPGQVRAKKAVYVVKDGNTGGNKVSTAEEHMAAAIEINTHCMSELQSTFDMVSNGYLAPTLPTVNLAGEGVMDLTEDLAVPLPSVASKGMVQLWVQLFPKTHLNLLTFKTSAVVKELYQAVHRLMKPRDLRGSCLFLVHDDGRLLESTNSRGGTRTLSEYGLTAPCLVMQGEQRSHSRACSSRTVGYPAFAASNSDSWVLL